MTRPRLIASLIAATALLTGCTHTTTPRSTRPPASACGIERWTVKTLTDPAAGQVSLTPTASTVATLRALAAPANPASRVAGVEMTTYQLTGTIVFAKQEADSDLHLVLEDPAGRSMIIEAPSPACARSSRVLAQITAVRQAVDQRFGRVATQPYAPGVSYTVNVPVTVTGIGFFDRLHGQTGVAPNGIELHPLTSIQFTGRASGPQALPNLHLTEHAGTD